MQCFSIFILSCLSVIIGAFDGRDIVLKVMDKQRVMSKFLEEKPELFTSISERNDQVFSVRSILSTIEQANALNELSHGCREDFELILNSMKNSSAYPAFAGSALIKMIDSTGKLSPAILLGHVYFAGHYSECKDIDYAVDGRERHFRADYFRMDLDPKLRPNNRNDSCTPVVPFVSLLDAFWHVGVCLPASCSSAELQLLLRPESSNRSNATQSNSVIPNPVCSFTKPGDLTPEINSGYYITLSIMGIIVGVCIMSGIVDFFWGDKVKETPLSKSPGWQLFMSCSLYTNVASIFDVSGHEKTGQICPIHCIRFFSMLWVLLTHLVASYTAVVANPTDILLLIPDLSSEILMNGFFSVDSFFFMSGVLLTFLWFKAYNHHPDETMSKRGWVLFYVHRFLRLSPPFYMIVFFYTFVFKQMIKDSPISMNPMTEDKCSSSWWVEPLYLHNWIDRKEMASFPKSESESVESLQCLGYSWYLAADMQMFLFTPLLIIPLAIKPLWGFIVAAVIFAISTGANIFLVCYYHWPAGMNIIFSPDPEMTNFENYPFIMYSNPLIRCQIYIMGMLVGWFLQTRKQLRIHPIVYISAWVIGISLMLTVLLGLHDQTNGTAISLFGRAMYSSLSRPAWGIGLSAIVILCYYGYGGPINSFMSWHIWVPLGRLSYCGYLIHIPVIHLVLSMTKDEQYFSSFIEFFIGRVVAITAVTYFLAVFWSACFELSFGRIEKLLIGGLGVEKREEEEVLIQDDEEDLENDQGPGEMVPV